MNKTKSKILLFVVLFITAIALCNAKVLANSNVTTQTKSDEAFEQFSKQKNNVTYNLYLGEKVSVVNWNIGYFLKPTVTINNKNIAVIKDDYSIKKVEVKKVGSTTGCITVTHNGKTVKKNFKINVKSAKISNKLDSKTNDVVSITGISKAKTQVLLANGELWNTNSNTFKLTKKSTGNVAKYVYSDVYFQEGKNTLKTTVMITSMLKNDKKLTVQSPIRNFSISKVKDVSKYGYLRTNGDYYGIVLSNNKLTAKKKATKVSKLMGDYLLLKGNKLYTVGNKKISDLKVKDAKGYAGNGLILTTDNKLYVYSYDYKTKKYSVKLVEKNVKQLLNGEIYKTSSGKVKRYKFYKDDKRPSNILETFYVAESELQLKTNKDLCINNKKILTKVENVTYALGTKYNSALITRADGSIWKLDLGGKAKLSKVRSGSNNNKKISKPTNLKVKQAGKTSAKITWKKVEGATKYTVYRATSKNGKYTKVGKINKTTFTDKKLKKGKNYYYKVVASTKNSLYDSNRTNSVKVKIKK